jgi:hypothetical protein
MSTLAPLVTVHHVKCGGQITFELAADGEWRNQFGSGPRLIEIGRCDKCGLAGIVCEPKKLMAVGYEIEPEDDRR